MRANAGHLPGTQREQGRSYDAQWHECGRASWLAGRHAKAPPPERRLGARRSGLGKTEARHATNLASVLIARSAVDGRTEGGGMGPPDPRGTLSQHLRRQQPWLLPMFFFCSKHPYTECQAQKKNKDDPMFCGRPLQRPFFQTHRAAGRSKKDEHKIKTCKTITKRSAAGLKTTTPLPRNNATKRKKKHQKRPSTYDPAPSVTLLLCHPKRD